MSPAELKLVSRIKTEIDRLPKCEQRDIVKWLVKDLLRLHLENTRKETPCATLNIRM